MAYRGIYIYRHGLCSHGLYDHGLYSYGLQSSSLCNYDTCALQPVGSEASAVMSCMQRKHSRALTVQVAHATGLRAVSSHHQPDYLYVSIGVASICEQVRRGARGVG